MKTYTCKECGKDVENKYHIPKTHSNICPSCRDKEKKDNALAAARKKALSQAIKKVKRDQERDKKEYARTYKICKCGKEYNKKEYKHSLCPDCWEAKEAVKYTYTCYRCDKVYDKRVEYKDHMGSIPRDLCKRCCIDEKTDYAEFLIWRSLRIKEKYNERSYIVHALNREVRFGLKMSRNDVRIFGWNTGLVSSELISSPGVPWTLDHINGMVTIIVTTALKVIDGELSEIDEVVDFIDRMSCVIKVSQKLNVNELKALQLKKVSIEDYYRVCKGMFTKDGIEISFETFKKEYSKYFISAA